MKKVKNNFLGGTINYLKKHKVKCVFIFVVVLMGVVTISTTFGFFSGTASSRIINGTVFNYETAKENFKYYIYDADESDYVLSYVEPAAAFQQGHYTLNTTLSTCTVRSSNYSSTWKSLYSSGTDLIELCKDGNIYYDQVGSGNTANIVINYVKQLRGTTCGNNCGEVSTNQSLESLFQEGYTVDFTNSSCTNDAGFIVDYKNALINVTVLGSNSSQPETTCTIKLLKNSDFASTIKAANPPASTSVSLENNTTATTDEGLITTIDDYGTTYYFRGNVQDNYFYFSGKMWRIIRINGDGSVRIIADASPISVGYHASQSSAGFRLVQSNTDTRGTLNGTMNTAQSMISSMYSMFVSTANDKYVSDRTVFCNDVDEYSDSARTARTHALNADYSIGAPMPTKYFGEDLSTPSQLNLKCPSVRDLFSKNILKDKAYHDVDTIYEEGTALTKPMSMISAKESVLAGNILDATNPSSYLSSYDSWTISPAYFSVNGLYVYKIAQGGIVSAVGITTSVALRPVISIVPGVPVSGNGTSACPYEITAIRTYNC